MVSFNAVNHLTGTIVSKLYDSETTATFLALMDVVLYCYNTTFVFNTDYGLKKYLD